ncbi:MAG: carbon starvation CstA family protein, partial [Olsenella sp.]
MNGVVVIVVAAVALIAGYVLYGRWLASSWGIDKSAVTPAHRMEDNRDFVPASRFAVFSHQFSSICG